MTLPQRIMAEGLLIRDLIGAVRGPFTLAVPHGFCVAVTGPSGIGKSLLLRMIADLDPNTGVVTLDGANRATMSAPAWRRKVTYVAAESGWWEDRVGDHMADLSAAKQAFPAFGLDAALVDAPVARLSTGERQRAALVRAVIQDPAMLLLDEPTSALDPASTLLVEGELLRLKQAGTGLLLVSHNAEQAHRLADRHLVMSRDGLAALAP
ncbi:ATP-binding cassette domain-containing protein [Lichenihabitans sp. PAMC28606]|uniref:ABC transporter ATP-binding protein n=1 Tax=Lichenihabitans sp. PAMC28606 TaxID=2880932 RepID=UPI001D09A558|nr:ATP-binding cassette domain-containing protein [Lichenihabitans sp. PAMC28606]UDL95971.1 ATP-binding cassette domain-containing protein [Lichenihabitans sp. PAMC28606]